MTIAPATLSIRIARCERGWASTFVPPAGAPIARLLRGKRPEEAAVLVPRLFSLCGAAQEAAIRSAFGLPVPATLTSRIGAEILTEHVLRLCLVWPSVLGLAPDREAVTLARNALADDGAARALRRRLFAPLDGAPRDLTDLAAYRSAADSAPARLLNEVMTQWDGHWGQADLPEFVPARPVEWDRATQGGRPVENSPAGRARSDLLAAIAERHGKGIVWRIAARLVEVERLLAGEPAGDPAKGAAEAARGTLLVRGEGDADGISAFERLSPTDFALAPGGLLETALATLPLEADAPTGRVARFIVETIDPCVATEIEVADA